MIVIKHKQGLNRQEWDDAVGRAAIDGRVSFAVAALVAAVAVLALLDRIGAPERLVASLSPALAIVGLAIIGFMLRSMRLSGFHAAGRATPGVYAGLAMAALGAGLAAPFAPSGLGNASLSSLLTGFGAGMSVAGLFVGPLLRKTGAFSIADLIATRFPSLTLSAGVTLAITAIGLCLGLAGLAMAQAAIAQATGLGPQLSLILAASIVGLAVIPGGMAGLVWSAAGAAGLLIAGLAAPLALMIASGASMPLPLPGDSSFEKAMAQMAQWGGANAPEGVDPMLACAIALGLCALPPLLAPMMTTPRRREARSGGLTGIVWCFLLALMALMGAAASTLALQSTMTGLHLADMPPFLLEASGWGLISICKAHPANLTQAREACGLLPDFGGTLRASDITATGEFLLSALPNLSGFGAAFSGLALAARMAMAIALSAAGFMALATARGDRAFYQTQKSPTLTSRRLALTRLILLGVIIGAAWHQFNAETDPQLLIGAALGVSAVAIAPLLVLSLWPRAEGQDGAVALVVGLAMAELILLMSGDALTVDVLARAGTIGFISAIAAGVTASLRHSTEPVSDGAAFLNGLLNGTDDILHPDTDA